MAVNPVTNVDSEVDRFAIWRASTSQYTNLNAVWPRPDGGPIQGGNPDFEYYKKVPGTPPDVDHRYTLTSVSDKVPADPTPPEGHPRGTYEPVYTLTKYSPEVLKAQVETEFQRQLQLQFPQTSNPSVLIEAADAITRKQKGAVLTAEQQATLDAVTNIGTVVAMLRTRQAELNAAIDADEDYDITDGWVTA